MRFTRGFLYVLMKNGDNITWRTLNGTRSGVIVAENGSGYLVKLDNGKYVIVNQKSIQK